MVYAPAIWGAVALPLPRLSLDWASLLVQRPQTRLVQAQAAVEPELVIPKLDIKVAAQENVTLSSAAVYNQALTEGVAVALGSTPLTGHEGNTVVFGHSSRWSLAPSQYDTIFAGLPSLREGDEIHVVQGDAIARYAVAESKSIRAQEVEYIQQTDDRRLTLITCWPLGTNLRRWLVIAHPVATD